MSTKDQQDLPVAVIGAGPVGLAAAAQLLARGLTPLIFERGVSVGASLLEWGHVRVFSPWAYNMDRAARDLLEISGWTAPPAHVLPTGAEIVRDYLLPLAALPPIASNLRLRAEVTGISRHGFGKLSNTGREASPFAIRYRDGAGEHRALARAVIDASGTWGRPNPIGVDGLPVAGEREAADRISYGIPEVAGAAREDYAGKRVLVIGGGHSATNTALALLELQKDAPATEIFWALRQDRIERLFGGGLSDQLPKRGALGLAAKEAIEARQLRMLAPFAVERIEKRSGGLLVEATLGNGVIRLEVDRIVVATGFRPDFSFVRELRVALDPVVEAPPRLAPLIDPNIHSCGTVPPHGIDELAHPEPDFVVLGSKSYGRAPTFLMATGYEQARSVAAELAGDREAARQVRLALPETGICNGSQADDAVEAAGCCGGPAPVGTGACCARDAVAKASGQAGCGCANRPEPAHAPVSDGGCCRSAA